MARIDQRGCPTTARPLSHRPPPAGDGIPFGLETASIALYAILGLLFMVITPPFQVPDEPSHFYRAYQVSQGILIAEKRGDRSGGELPKSLGQTVEAVMKQIHFHPHEKQDVRDIVAAFHYPLNPGDTVFCEFPNTALYSPVPYIPQAAGIRLGRWFDLPPVALLYLARFSNLLVSATIMVLAIRTAPFLRSLFFLLGFMPMTLFLTASASADAVTIAMSFFLIALILRITYEASAGLDWRNAVSVIACAVLLTLCKSVYFLLPFLSLLIPRFKASSRAAYVGFWVFLVFVVFSGFLFWNGIVEQVYTPIMPGRGFFPTLQEARQFVIEHPVPYFKVLYNSVAGFAPHFSQSFIGTLGWLDTYLPVPVVVAYYAVLGAAAVLDGRSDVNISVFCQRVWIGMLVLMTLVLIVTSQFFIWTGKERSLVGDLQGRYLIPLGPLVFLLFHTRRLSGLVSRRVRERFPQVFVAAMALLSLAILFRRYYVS